MTFFFIALFALVIIALSITSAILDPEKHPRLRRCTMPVLERAKKVRVDDKDWQLIRINPSQEEILQELSLLPKPEQPPKKKPGRPKGSRKKEVTMAATDVPKKRGRPKGSKNKPKTQPAETIENGVVSP